MIATGTRLVGPYEIITLVGGGGMASVRYLPVGRYRVSRGSSTLQLCQGLAAAHEKGIVHRD